MELGPHPLPIQWILSASPWGEITLLWSQDLHIAYSNCPCFGYGAQEEGTCPSSPVCSPICRWLIFGNTPRAQRLEASLFWQVNQIVVTHQSKWVVFRNAKYSWSPRKNWIHLCLFWKIGYLMQNKLLLLLIVLEFYSAHYWVMA